jgi:hypothetical protein
MLFENKLDLGLRRRMAVSRRKRLLAIIECAARQACKPEQPFQRIERP